MTYYAVWYRIRKVGFSFINNRQLYKYSYPNMTIWHIHITDVIISRDSERRIER